METNALLFATLQMAECRAACEEMAANKPAYIKPESHRKFVEAINRPVFWPFGVETMAERLLGAE